MRENNFPQVWVPSLENRDLRQLLWHRHRMVQLRTRIMNQLQALAMNEGYRSKKKPLSEQGRTQLEKLALAPWASRHRRELLELLDRMNPTFEELTAAVEREARKRPEVLRLMTHPGVGPLTALADHRHSDVVRARQADRHLPGNNSVCGLQMSGFAGLIGSWRARYMPVTKNRLLDGVALFSLFVCCSMVTDSITDILRNIQKTGYVSRCAAVAG